MDLITLSCPQLKESTLYCVSEQAVHVVIFPCLESDRKINDNQVVIHVLHRFFIGRSLRICG